MLVLTPKASDVCQAGLRTPRHSPKSIPPCARVHALVVLTQMANLALGGAKGEPGKYLERHSRGRGHINKATRTLWRLLSTITTAMPSLNFSKTSVKSNDPSVEPSTSVNKRRHDCLPLFTLCFLRWPRCLSGNFQRDGSTRSQGDSTSLPAGPIHYSQESSDRDSRWSLRSIWLCLVAPRRSRNIKVRPG